MLPDRLRHLVVHHEAVSLTELHTCPQAVKAGKLLNAFDVAARLPGRPTVEIQAKTASGDGDKTAWILGTKAQLVAKSVHEWFALVMLPSLPKPPRTFIVPRNHLSAATWVAHQTWRTDPTVPEGRRNTDLALARINATVWRGYEDRWDLLGTPTSDVPVLLPSWIRSRSKEERVGLPPGHPWNESLPDG